MKTAKVAEPTVTHDLTPTRTDCAHCGRPMWADYANRRTLHTLVGVTRLNMTIRRCRHATCAGYKKPYRPEAEGSFALPRHEFGLDVIALIGRLRYAEHRSVPEIRAHLVGRQVSVSERTVTNLLDRYDELLAVALADDRRLKKVLASQKKVILAIDGLQPDVGHEVLWVIRDVLSGEILLAKSLLSARNTDLAALLGQVKANCPVPVAGIVSDGQHSIRKAVAKTFRACRTNCASSTTCGRPPGRFTRRIGTPRRNSRRRFVVCGRSSVRSRSRPARRRRWCVGTARRSAVR